MITQKIIELGLSISSWFLGLLPQHAPDWLVDSGDGIAHILKVINSWTVWVPWNVLKVVCIGLMAFWLVIWLIKLLMRVWSYVPFIGGAG